jgi:DNA mismatch endonuclease (patch repair protein)
MQWNRWPRRRISFPPSTSRIARENTDPVRSALMSRVRQAGTRPEKAVAVALRAMGIAYRLNSRSLPGSPDFANRRRKWAIFVHGCFWHHHTGCRRATVPTRNREFWVAKFAANRSRDARSIRALRRAGFSAIIVWECETLDSRTLQSKLSKLSKAR